MTESMFPDRFETWWALYPKKTGKSGTHGAQAKFRRLTDDDQAACITGTEVWVRYWVDNDTPRQYIPNPTTFLNQRRWEDDLPRLPRDTNGATDTDDDRDPAELVANMRAGHTFITLDGDPAPNPWTQPD